MPASALIIVGRIPVLSTSVRVSDQIACAIVLISPNAPEVIGSGQDVHLQPSTSQGERP